MRLCEESGCEFNRLHVSALRIQNPIFKIQNVEPKILPEWNLKQNF